MSVHGHPRLYFESVKLLNFYFDAYPDPDPAFHCNADPDPAFKKQKWCGSRSVPLLTASSLLYGHRTTFPLTSLLSLSKESPQGGRKRSDLMPHPLSLISKLACSHVSYFTYQIIALLSALFSCLLVEELPMVPRWYPGTSHSQGVSVSSALQSPSWTLVLLHLGWSC